MLGNITLFIGVCLIGLGVYLSPTSYFYKWIGISLYLLGIMTLTYIFTKWIISLSSIGYRNISLLQWNCVWDIVIFWLWVIFLLAITLISKKHDLIYCISVTYAEGIIALCLIIVDNRYTRLEILNLRDVSDIYIYIFLYMNFIMYIIYTYI
jgi:hypothetical protein